MNACGLPGQCKQKLEDGTEEDETVMSKKIGGNIG
jgi:hypothetical protein